MSRLSTKQRRSRRRDGVRDHPLKRQWTSKTPLNYVFTSGDANFLSEEVKNRRFELYPHQREALKLLLSKPMRALR